MSGLDPQLVSHQLNINESCKLVKRIPRNFRPELKIQIKEEIQKLLDVGFKGLMQLHLSYVLFCKLILIIPRLFLSHY